MSNKWLVIGEGGDMDRGGFIAKHNHNVKLRKRLESKSGICDV